MAKRMNRTKPTKEMNDLLLASTSPDRAVASDAMFNLAVALETPLKQGILKGSNNEGIFEVEEFQPGAAIEYPLDFLAPGTEKDHVAYTIPGQGKIPERHVEGDFLMVPTYDIASSIDWRLQYARDCRWPMIERAMQVLEASFIRKDNDDSWHTILAAAVARNVVVYDDAAPAGLFTKRAIALSKTIMMRRAGGNATSVNKGELTDVYMSPESLEDMRSWDLTQIDDFTRRQIFMAGEGEASLTSIFKVNIHNIVEFGASQLYETYYETTLGGTLPASKTEIAVGLDLSRSNSFVNPVRQALSLYEDTMLHRQIRAGFYGWKTHGWAVLDSRNVILIAI